MDLTKLFETQRILVGRIEMEHPRVEGDNRLAKKILALLVELSECANEWRGFKFWSTNQEPCTFRKERDFFSDKAIRDYNPLLEEYVDALHLILDLGIEYEIRVSDLRNLHPDDEDSVESQFIMLNVLITEIYLTPKENAINDYRDLFNLYLGLGEMLGFTKDQIEEAYYAKNIINHERQATGY